MLHINKMLAAASICFTATAFATPTLSFGDINVQIGESATIPVTLTGVSGEEITMYQFDITLPEGLAVTNVASSIKTINPQLQAHPNGNPANIYRVGVFQSNFFRPTYLVDGENLVLTIEATADAVAGEGIAEVSFINFAQVSGTGIDLDDFTVPTLVEGEHGSETPDPGTGDDPQQPDVNPTAQMSVNPTAIVVKEGETQTISIDITNNFNIAAMNFSIMLPEGMELVANVDGEYLTKTDRVPESTLIVDKDNGGGKYSFIFMDMSNEIVEPGNGAVATFTVAGSENLAAEGTITISGINYSTRDYKTIYNDDVEVAVVNAEIALNNAKAVIAGLQVKFEEAKQNLPKGVRDQFEEDENAIVAQIGALQDAVNAAYADNTLTPNYDEIVTAVKSNIDAAIEDLVARANEAEVQRVADNNEAYNQQIEALEMVRMQLEEAVEDCEYAEYINKEDLQKIYDQLDAYKTAAEEEIAKVAEEGTYEGVFDSNDMMNLMQEAANVMLAAHGAANQAAYNKDIEAIDALQNDLDATAEDENANYINAETKENIQKAINELRDEADNNIAAVEGEDEDYAPVATEETVQDIEDQISEMLAAAAQAKADEIANQERQAANRKAWEADRTMIVNLQNEYDAAIETINNDYNGLGNEQTEADIQTAIDDMMDNINRALKAVEAEGTYVSPITKSELDQISENISAMVDEAKAEFDRQEANTAAYDADLETIADLREALNNALETAENNNPGQNFADRYDEINEMINLAAIDVEEAYNAVAEEGNYETPATVDFDEIRAQIENLANTVSTGITAFAQDGVRVALNGNNVIVTGAANTVIMGTDGKVYVNATGEVNISLPKGLYIVKAGNATTKIML